MLFITIGLAVVLMFAAPHKVQASVISSPGADTFDIKAGDSRLHGLEKGATVPEPSSLALILAGALALLLPRVIGAFRSLSQSLQKYTNVFFEGGSAGYFEFGEKLNKVLAGEPDGPGRKRLVVENFR